jgi:hypothetical protein
VIAGNGTVPKTIAADPPHLLEARSFRESYISRLNRCLTLIGLDDADFSVSRRGVSVRNTNKRLDRE